MIYEESKNSSSNPTKVRLPPIRPNSSPRIGLAEALCKPPPRDWEKGFRRGSRSVPHNRSSSHKKAQQHTRRRNLGSASSRDRSQTPADERMRTKVDYRKRSVRFQSRMLKKKEHIQRNKGSTLMGVVGADKKVVTIDLLVTDPLPDEYVDDADPICTADEYERTEKTLCKPRFSHSDVEEEKGRGRVGSNEFKRSFFANKEPLGKSPLSRQHKTQALVDNADETVSVLTAGKPPNEKRRYTTVRGLSRRLRKQGSKLDVT